MRDHHKYSFTIIILINLQGSFNNSLELRSMDIIFNVYLEWFLKSKLSCIHGTVDIFYFILMYHF